MAKIVVKICVGTHCVLMGSMDLLDAVTSLREIEQEKDQDLDLQILPVPCPGICRDGQLAPVVWINDKPFYETDSESIMARILEMARVD